MARRSLLVLVSAVLVIGGAATATASASGRTNPLVGLPAWDRVPTPPVGSGSNELRGVQAFSPTDVWAVGHAGNVTLTEHWDGTSFTVAPSPSVPDRGNVLEDVDGVSPSDAWAVGHADVTQFLGSVSLAEHWDGSAWARVSTPNVGGSTTYNDLTGVAALSPTNAWTVGTLENLDHGSRFHALIQHWNGTKWALVRNSCGEGLSKVDARAANDIWAVGGSDACHWNGASWTHFTVDPPPNPQVGVSLVDVTVVAPDDAWAVGYETYTCGEGQVCFSGDIHHWNGQRWTYVSSAFDYAYGVDAVAANDIWAVGTGPAILHYDGQSWSEVPNGVGVGNLRSVEASGPDDIWAAGESVGASTGTLVERAPSPVSGAVVGSTHVSGATVSWFGPESGSVTTDVFGDYEVGSLTAGTYTFTVTYTGCTPATGHVTVVAGDTIERDFHLGC